MYCYNGFTYFRKPNNYYNYSIISLYLILIQQLQYYIDSTLKHINNIIHTARFRKNKNNDILTILYLFYSINMTEVQSLYLMSHISVPTSGSTKLLLVIVERTHSKN